MLKWRESVVTIDEYDKMKQKSAKPGTVMNIAGQRIPIAGAKESLVDNSADEVLRSISSTGSYKFMDTKIDCNETLFILTSNQSRKEI